MVFLRVLTATGIEELDKEIAKKLALRDIEVAGECYYREGLLGLAEERGAGVVVLSIQLPGDGEILEVVKKLRLSGLRVVLLPGRRKDEAALELARRAIALGVYDLVWDPVNPGVVVHRIENPATLADAVSEDLALINKNKVENDITVPVENKSGKTPFWQTLIKKHRKIDKGENPVDTIAKAIKQPPAINLEIPQHEDQEPDNHPEEITLIQETLSNEARFQAKPLFSKKPSVFHTQPAIQENTVPIPPRENEPAQDIADSKVTVTNIDWNTTEIYQDVLTGCLSRRYLLEEYKYTGPCTVVFIDLDSFKPVNDTLGHEAGDLVLASFGKMLNQHLKGRDLAVRWGGDEFVLVLPETPYKAAGNVVENIRRAWKENAPYTGNLEVGFSTGIAECKNAGNIQLAIKEADRLVYSDKKSRKTRKTWEKSRPRKYRIHTPKRFTVPVDWAAFKSAASLVISMIAVAVLISGAVLGLDKVARLTGANAPVLHEAAKVVEEVFYEVKGGR